jgi:hypothetical protein
MMNTLSQIDPGTILLIVGGLCALGIVATIVLPIVSTLLDIVGLVGGILTGDPSSCCGCIVLAGVLAACGCFAAFAVSVWSSCGTPQAMAFCSWLGR